MTLGPAQKIARKVFSWVISVGGSDIELYIFYVHVQTVFLQMIVYSLSIYPIVVVLLYAFCKENCTRPSMQA